MVAKKDVELAERIQQLEQAGYAVTKTPLVSGRQFKVNLERYDQGTPFKFGVVSDTHIGSQYQQMTHLTTFYSICEKEGVKFVLHAGDLVDGYGVYRSQEYEVFLHGHDAQRDYVVSHYPKIGVKTYVIGGNHEESLWKLAGCNILADVGEKRDDIVYLGMFGAMVEVNGLKFYLHHGAGGVAYARSYKLQRLIQELAPEQKPNFLFAGHWHVPCYLPGYRNVEGVQMSCFQSQTPYIKRLGVYPFIAGLIVEVKPDKRGIAWVKYQWYPYYQVKKEDF